MIGRRRPLRVLVSPALRAHHAQTGHGRLFARGLAELDRLARVREVAPGGRARGDVWFTDVFETPPPAGLPAVGYVSELPWVGADASHGLHPAFLEQSAATAAGGVARCDRIVAASSSSASQVREAYGGATGTAAGDGGVVAGGGTAVGGGTDGTAAGDGGVVAGGGTAGGGGTAVGGDGTAAGDGGAGIAASVAGPAVDVVPLGVDLAVHGAGRGDAGRAAVGAALGGDDAPPYVLFAGQVHARKNLPALRAAMERLAGPALVVLASPAVDRPDSDALLREAVAPLDGAPLVALPRPDDGGVADLMAGAAAVCVPSLWEGFGLVALEAMAAGAPVVVSDRGSLPEVVGDAGVVVEPTPEALAQGLRSVLDDPARAAALTEAGRARAATMTWAQTARGWLASLERAAGRP